MKYSENYFKVKINPEIANQEEIVVHIQDKRQNRDTALEDVIKNLAPDVLRKGHLTLYEEDDSLFYQSADNQYQVDNLQEDGNYAITPLYVSNRSFPVRVQQKTWAKLWDEIPTPILLLSILIVPLFVFIGITTYRYLCQTTRGSEKLTQFLQLKEPKNFEDFRHLLKLHAKSLTLDSDQKAIYKEQIARLDTLINNDRLHPDDISEWIPKENGGNSLIPGGYYDQETFHPAFYYFNKIEDGKYRITWMEAGASEESIPFQAVYKIKCSEKELETLVLQMITRGKKGKVSIEENDPEKIEALKRGYARIAKPDSEKEQQKDSTGLSARESIESEILQYSKHKKPIEKVTDRMKETNDSFDLIGAALHHIDSPEIIGQALHSLEVTLTLIEKGIDHISEPDRTEALADLGRQIHKLESRSLQIFGNQTIANLFPALHQRIQTIKSYSQGMQVESYSVAIFNPDAIRKALSEESSQITENILLRHLQAINQLRNEFNNHECDKAFVTLSGLTVILEQLVNGENYGEAIQLASEIHSLLPVPLYNPTLEGSRNDFWCNIPLDKSLKYAQRLKQMTLWSEQIEKLAACQAKSSIHLKRKHAEPEELLNLMNSRIVLQQLARVKGGVIEKKQQIKPANWMRASDINDGSIYIYLMNHEEAKSYFFARCSPDLGQIRDIMHYHPVMKMEMNSVCSERSQGILGYVDSSISDRSKAYPQVRFDGRVSAPSSVGGMSISDYIDKNDMLVRSCLYNIAYCCSANFDGDLFDAANDVLAAAVNPENSYYPTEAGILAKHTAWMQMLIRPELCLTLQFEHGGVEEISALAWWEEKAAQADKLSEGDLSLKKKVMSDLIFNDLYQVIDKLKGPLELITGYNVFGSPNLQLTDGTIKLAYIPWGVGLPESLSAIFSPTGDDFLAAKKADVPEEWLRGLLGQKNGEFRTFSSPRITASKTALYLQDAPVSTEPHILNQCLRLEGVDGVDEYLLRSLTVAKTNSTKPALSDATLEEILHFVVTRPDLLASQAARSYIDILFSQSGILTNYIKNNLQSLEEFCHAMHSIIETQMNTNPKAVLFLMHLGSRIYGEYKRINPHAIDDRLFNIIPHYGAPYQPLNQKVQSGINIVLQILPSENDLANQALVEAMSFAMLNEQDLDKAFLPLIQSQATLFNPLSVLGSPLYLSQLQHFFETQMIPYFSKMDLMIIKKYIPKILADNHLELDLQENWQAVPNERLTFINGDWQICLLSGEIRHKGEVFHKLENKVLLPEHLEDRFSLFGYWFNIKKRGNLKVKRSQGALPGKWEYRFNKGNRAFKIIHNLFADTVSIKMKIDQEWHVWKTIEGNGEGFASLSKEYGLWVNESHPGQCSMIMAPIKNWQEKDRILLTIDMASGHVQTAYHQQNPIVISTKSLQRKLKPAHPNHVFKVGDSGVLIADKKLMLDIRGEALYLKDSEKRLISEFEERAGKGNALKEILGDEVAVLFVDEKEGQKGHEYLYLWPHQIDQSSSGSIKILKTNELSKAQKQHCLQLHINPSGKIEGSAAAFLYVAYVLLQKKDFNKAQQFISLARLSGLDTPEDRAAFVEVEQLINKARPVSGESIATYLKAQLAMIDIARAQIEREEYIPTQQSEYIVKIRKLSKLYQEYLKAVENLQSSIFQKKDLQLNEEEIARLEACKREGFIALLADQSIHRTTSQNSLGPVTKISDNFIPTIIHEAVTPLDDELQGLMCPSPLSSDLLLSHFCWYFNQIQNQKKLGKLELKEWAFLFQPLEDKRGVSLNSEQKGRVALADTARRLLLQLLEDKNIDPIPIQEILTKAETSASIGTGFFTVVGKFLHFGFEMLTVSSIINELLATNNNFFNLTHKPSLKIPKNWDKLDLKTNFFAHLSYIVEAKKNAQEINIQLLHRVPPLTFDETDEVLRRCLAFASIQPLGYFQLTDIKSHHIISELSINMISEELRGVPTEIISAAQLMFVPLESLLKSGLKIEKEGKVITTKGVVIDEAKSTKEEHVIDVKMMQQEDRFNAAAEEMGLSEIEKEMYKGLLKTLDVPFISLDIMLRIIEENIPISTHDFRRENELSSQIQKLEERASQIKRVPRNDAAASPLPAIIRDCTQANIDKMRIGTTKIEEEREQKLTKELPAKIAELFNPNDPRLTPAEQAEFTQYQNSIEGTVLRLAEQMSFERTVEPSKVYELEQSLLIQERTASAKASRLKGLMLKWAKSNDCSYEEIKKMILRSDIYSDDDIFQALQDRFQQLDKEIDTKKIDNDTTLEKGMTEYLLYNSLLQQIPDAQIRVKALLEEQSNLEKDLDPSKKLYLYQLHLENSRKLCQILMRNMNMMRYIDNDTMCLKEPRLYRKILVLENRLKIVLRRAQEATLCKLHIDPEQLASLLMGEGKTAIIMPVIALLLIESGYFPIMLCPDMLQRINRIGFEATTRKSSGTRAEPFNPNLEKNCTAAYIASCYKTLLESYVDGRYIVAGADNTLASVANMLPYLRENLTVVEKQLIEGAKQEGDLAAFLKTKAFHLLAQKMDLNKKIKWLTKIEKLYNGEVRGIQTFFFADEVDSLFHITKEVNRAIGDSVELESRISNTFNVIADLLMAPEDTLGKMNWAALKGEEQQKLRILSQAFATGTQETIKTFKEEYVKIVAKALTMKFNMQMKDMEGFINYLSGFNQFAEGQEAWNNSQTQVEIACLKGCLTALNTIIGMAPGQKFKLSEEDGFQASPADLGRDIPGSQLADPFVRIGIQYVAFALAHKCKTKESDLTEKFFVKALEKLVVTDEAVFDELIRACKVLGVYENSLTKLAKLLATKPELWKARKILVKHSVFKNSLLKGYLNQAIMPLQATVSGRKFGGVTGTLNVYALPGFQTGDQRYINNTRLSETETFIRVAANIPEGFDKQLQIFDDTKLSAIFDHLNDSVLSDPLCSAMIMEGGYGMEGVSNHDFIQILKNFENGKDKNFLYMDAGKCYFWENGEQTKPYEIDPNVLKDSPMPFISVFSVEYTRGTDFPVKTGNTHYFPKRSPNAQDSGQSIWRGRGTGDRHTPVIHIPQSAFPNVKAVTLGDFILWSVKEGLKEQLPLNLMAQDFRINEPAFTAARNALNQRLAIEDSKEFDDEKNATINLILFLINNALHGELRSLQIVNKAVDWEKYYAPTKKSTVIHSLITQYEQQINLVKDKKSKMCEAFIHVLLQLDELGPRNFQKLDVEKFKTNFPKVVQTIFETQLKKPEMTLVEAIDNIQWSAELVSITNMTVLRSIRTHHGLVMGLEKCFLAYKELDIALKKLVGDATKFKSSVEVEVIGQDGQARKVKKFPMIEEHAKYLPKEREISGEKTGTKETVKQMQKQQNQTMKNGSKRSQNTLSKINTDEFEIWSSVEINHLEVSSNFESADMTEHFAEGQFFVSLEAKKLLDLLPVFSGDPIFKIVLNIKGQIVIIGKNDYHSVLSTHASCSRVFAPTHDSNIRLRGDNAIEERDRLKLAQAKWRLGYQGSVEEKEMLRDWFKALDTKQKTAFQSWASSLGLSLSFLVVR